MTGASGEEPGGQDVIAGADPDPRGRPHGRRPWSWALGGAAVTCALWAAAIVAWDPTHQPGPDLHGYHLRTNPCAGGSLAPLFSRTPARTYTPNPPLTVSGPALERTTCSAGNIVPGSVGKGGYDYYADVTVELHKKTDPRPEFEDQHVYAVHGATPASKVSAVHGLGDEAYLLEVDPSELQLKVVHGGAVFLLVLSVSKAQPDTPADAVAGPTFVIGGSPELPSYRDALITAARGVMTRLQHT